MLKVIEHISLDGVIQVGADTDGGFTAGDWSAPYRCPAGFAMVLAEWGDHFDVLLGRRTYDLWSSFWPAASASPMAERLNAATKYVVTHRPESLTWGPCESVEPNFIDHVRKLKAKEGPQLIVAGSSTITSQLLENDLVDEMLLLVNPVLLGRGKRLFAEGTSPRAFTLVNTRMSPTGILANLYKAAGNLQNLR